MISRLDASGTGSLAVYRAPHFYQGLKRGSKPVKLRRTLRQDKLEKLVDQESRLRATTEQGTTMIPYTDPEMRNLEDTVKRLQSGNRDSNQTKILINMVQQQAQMQQQTVKDIKSLEDTDLKELYSKVSKLSREPSSDVLTKPSGKFIAETRGRDINKGAGTSRSTSLPPEKVDMTEKLENQVDEKPNVIANVRRARGFNKPISNTDFGKLSIQDRMDMGLKTDATRNDLRKRVNDLGVVTTQDDGRPRSIRFIVADAIEIHKTRTAQRLEDISNKPTPTEEESTLV